MFVRSSSLPNTGVKVKWTVCNSFVHCFCVTIHCPLEFQSSGRANVWWSTLIALMTRNLSNLTGHDLQLCMRSQVTNSSFIVAATTAPEKMPYSSYKNRCQWSSQIRFEDFIESDTTDGLSLIFHHFVWRCILFISRLNRSLTEE